MKALAVLICALVVHSASAQGAVPCPATWLEKSGRCYYFNIAKLSWAKAEKFCHSIGGNLASVHTALENQAVLEVAMKFIADTNGIWVGGSNAQQSDVWLWSDGSKFLYTYWCAGEPNSSVCKQHCLQVNYSALRCWDDDQCSDAKPSVCVRKPTK